MRLKKFYEFINTPSITANNFPLYKRTSYSPAVNTSTEYDRRYYNDLLMRDVIDISLYEYDSNDLKKTIIGGNLQTNPEEFYNSFNASKRVEYMTPYTVDDLYEFRLFKVPRYKIGFAIKSDGDIILVHNNSSKKGIGEFLIKRAIKEGGTKLDHFDGFLTGFYRSLGFNLVGNDHFLDEYTPDNWRFTPIDINDKNKSIYAGELKVDIKEMEEAIKRYSSGRPDIAYRSIS